MGIPSYFSHIIKNYSNIVRGFSVFFNQSHFQHLYMDCNSIIYDAVHLLQNSKINHLNFETALIDEVIRKIEDYITMIKPTQSVFIAFDGVAPLAKMEQQRTRRYKSAFMANIDFHNGSPPTTSTATSTSKPFNTAAITPGTTFMQNLSSRIEAHFITGRGKQATSNGLKNSNGDLGGPANAHTKRIEYIVSTSNQAGEGEHKLFSHLRSHPELINDNIAVYGLDSDLIMLSIFHLKYCKNIHIFREAPEFLKSMIPVQTSSDKNEPHFLDILHLSKSILSEMDCKYPDTTRIYDYVFLCFFLGNDFLPHFPAMNIRTHGIQVLLDLYRKYIGSNQGRYLVSNTTGEIQWKYVRLLVQEVAKLEHQFLKQEYFARDKMEKRKFPENTSKEREEAFNNIPIMYRQEEKYICPNEKFWEQRYYKTLFHIDKPDEESKRKICQNYIEGLEWVYMYYTRGCIDWRWKYDYNYGPLFADLVRHVPHFEMRLIKDKPANPVIKDVQLSYVLSRDNFHLIPVRQREYILTHHLDKYPAKYEFCWAFCRYMWEAHPVLPHINIGDLEITKKVVNSNNSNNKQKHNNAVSKK